MFIFAWANLVDVGLAVWNLFTLRIDHPVIGNTIFYCEAMPHKIPRVVSSNVEPAPRLDRVLFEGSKDQCLVDVVFFVRVRADGGTF